MWAQPLIMDVPFIFNTAAAECVHYSNRIIQDFLHKNMVGDVVGWIIIVLPKLKKGMIRKNVE